jgi:hypothetical protein
MKFYNSWSSQVEILPRFTIVYGKTQSDEDENLIAFEWLWFGVFVGLGKMKGKTIKDKKL